MLDILRRQSSTIAQHSLRVSELLSGLLSTEDPPEEDPQSYAEAVEAFEKQRTALDGLLLGPMLDLKTLATTSELLEMVAKEVVLRMPWPGLRQQVRVITFVSSLRGGLSVFAAGIWHILAAEEARPGSVLPDYMFCRVDR